MKTLEELLNNEAKIIELRRQADTINRDFQQKMIDFKMRVDSATTVAELENINADMTAFETEFYSKLLAIKEELLALTLTEK